MSGNCDHIKALLPELHGRNSRLQIPKLYIRATGDLKIALFIDEAVYLSDKGDAGDGWFYKSYPDWEENVFLSKHEVARVAEYCKEAGFLETKLQKVGTAPVLHYRIDVQKLADWIADLRFPENGSPIVKKPEVDSEKTGDPTLFFYSPPHLHPTPLPSTKPNTPAASDADLKTVRIRWKTATRQTLNLKPGSTSESQTLEMVSRHGLEWLLDCLTTWLNSSPPGATRFRQSARDYEQFLRYAATCAVNPKPATPRAPAPSASPTPVASQTADAAVAEKLDAVAIRIHDRHPSHASCPLKIVKQQLWLILRKNPDREPIALLDFIDSQSLKWCESEDWMDEDGKYVKGLKAWLDPEEERWEANPKRAYVDPYEYVQDMQARLEKARAEDAKRDK